jgi:hypothetical protein
MGLSGAARNQPDRPHSTRIFGKSEAPHGVGSTRGPAASIAHDVKVFADAAAG